jgi:aldehyde dehydrogenase (NAD+)/betaine-aldehyde dehydrogenase
MVDLVVDEVGSPVTLARGLQVAQPARNFRWFADAARRGPVGGYEERLDPSPGPARAHSTLFREPVGVVAAIVPYNYPLNMVSWKLGPALAAGCTVVLLPSPQGTLCALALTRLIEQAGFPPGAVNLVIGGVDTSQALIADVGVDLVSFTGSSAVGAEVMALAAQTTKKVILELGGKSPNILLPSADLAHATGQSILRYARNAGQGCGSTTRILVHADHYDGFVERATAFLRDEVPVGDPRLEETVIGPLISEAHLQRVEGYLARALEQGAHVLAGGHRARLGQGWYLEGTLIGGVANEQEICQEELFAPVAVVLPYSDIDEAVALANDSRYGLNSAVWGDPEEAMRVARRLDAGTVAINGGGDARSDVPWGGSKSSGRSTEMGADGFREFFRVRHIQWPVKPADH